MQRSPDNRYDRNGKLGQGAYGKVYLAIDRQTQEKVAVKKINLESNENGLPSIAIREVALLKDLSSHPNIVLLKDVLYYQNRLYLVFEWLDRDLKQYLDAVEKMDPLLIQSYLFQLLQGIRECHNHRIIHRDLKPQNLLINSEGRLKLADFGLSRGYDFPYRNSPTSARPFTNEVVTLWYRAPELLLGQTTYSTSIDIWSAGCIFAEMVTKKPLFPGDSMIDQLFRIFKTLGTPNNSTWPGVASFSQYNTFPRFPARSLSEVVPNLDKNGLQLLTQMIQCDPGQRISAVDALSHPYFEPFRSFLIMKNSADHLAECWS